MGVVVFLVDLDWDDAIYTRATNMVGPTAMLWFMPHHLGGSYG